ncbi:polysaccharide deacetylase family protein [Geodermatophilus sp. SYSU D00708]
MALASTVLVLIAASMVGQVTPAAEAAPNPTVVTLTFDDGNADQFPAEQTMTANGLIGTFYIVTGWIDGSGYLTRDQLSAMAEDGNEIGGHTVSHPDLTQLPAPEVRAEICDGRAVLESWGFQPTSFAYPFMRAIPAIEQEAADCGYNTSRGLVDIVAPGSCENCPYAESLPPEDPQYLKAPRQVDSSWTLDDMKAAVTNAVDHGGGWIILTFHHVCAPVGSAECPAISSTTPALFNEFVSWLAAFRADAANNTVVQTIDQTVRQYMGTDYQYRPAEAVAPRPPAPVGVNALNNPSLETDDPSTGFPSCWQPSHWGKNNHAWTTVSPGHTGNTAKRLEITEYTDGDAKLLPTLDIHSCAPTVEPGKVYQISVWYQSTGRTQFALYYRDASFRWANWVFSPWFDPPAAPTVWTEATFTTPPVPADATAMTFGLVLGDSGTLTTDDYRLVDSGRPAISPTASDDIGSAQSGTAGAGGDDGTSILDSPFVWTVAAVLALQMVLYVGPPSRRRQRNSL